MSDESRVLEFEVAENTYCLSIDHVGEVVSPTELSSAPDLPEDAVGLMEYRDTGTVEVWDAATVLRHEDTATLQRKHEINTALADQFETIEETIESLLADGRLTDTDAADELTTELVDLRETIVTAWAESPTSRVDQRKLLILADTYTHEGHRIGWLVDHVADIRTVTRDQLDDSIGGIGVYGAIHDPSTEQTTDADTSEMTTEEGDTSSQTPDVDHSDLTIWIDPETLVAELLPS